MINVYRWLIERDKVKAGCSEYQCMLKCLCSLSSREAYALLQRLAEYDFEQFEGLHSAACGTTCATPGQPQPAPAPSPSPGPGPSPGPSPGPGPGPGPEPEPTPEEKTCVEQGVEQACSESFRTAINETIVVLMEQDQIPGAMDAIGKLGDTFSSFRQAACDTDGTGASMDAGTIKMAFCSFVAAIGAAGVIIQLPTFAIAFYKAFRDCCGLPDLPLRPPMGQFAPSQGGGQSSSMVPIPVPKAGSSTPSPPVSSSDGVGDDIGAVVGGVLGGIAGTYVGGPAGTAIGAGLGKVVGAELGGLIEDGLNSLFSLRSSQIAMRIAPSGKPFAMTVNVPSGQQATLCDPKRMLQYHHRLFQALKAKRPSLTVSRYALLWNNAVIQQLTRRSIPTVKAKHLLIT